jgi:branched-chain amino acid transport system substrate-binding protein
MKKIKKESLVLMIFLLGVIALSACTPPGASETSGNGGGSGDEGDENTVTLGYTGPLSGGAADYGENALSGIELAVKQINEGGGFEVNGETYKYDLKSLDDKYQPSEAAINGQKFVQQFQAPIVFTPHSGGVLALQEFNESSNFIIAAYTSEPQVTATGNELTIRIPPSYAGYMEPFTKYEMDKFGKKLAMLPTNSAYGQAWTELFKEEWKKQGGQVVAETPLDYNNDTSFSAGISKALAKDPDVLFVGGPSEPTALVIKEARQLGFEGGFAVMDQAKFNEMAAVLGGMEPLNGSIGVLPLEYYDNTAKEEFVNSYKEEFSEQPGWEAGWNYMATYVFTEAMKQAGTVTDVEKIRANVESGMKNLPEDKQIAVLEGLSENGGFISERTIAAVENGQIKKIKVEQ